MRTPAYVPEAQDSLPRGPRHGPRARTSLGRAVRTMYDGTLQVPINGASLDPLYGPTEPRGTFVAGGTMSVTVKITA